MGIVCLFLPPFISVFASIKHSFNDTLNWKSCVTIYAIYNVLINFSMFLILKLFFHTESIVLTVSFTLKYIFSASVLGLVYFCLFVLIKGIIKHHKINFNNVKAFLKKDSDLARYVVLFALIIGFQYLFDVQIRYIADGLSNFYPVFNLCPTIMTFAYSILLFGAIIFLPKIVSKLLLLLTYIFSLVVYMVQFMLLHIKEEAFTVLDFTNASEAMEFLNFVIKEISWSFVLTIVISIIIIVFAFKKLDKIDRIRKIELTIKNKTIVLCRIKLYLVFLIVLVLAFLGTKFIAISTLDNYTEDDWEKITYPRYYHDHYINPKRSMTIDGLYEYTFRDAYIYFKNLRSNASNIEEVSKKIENRQITSVTNEYTGKFKDKNLIMIMLESVDNLMFNEELMPTLTTMSNEGWNFPKRYSQLSSGGSTIATEFTSVTGLFYMGSGYNIDNNHYYESLPYQFSAAGYQTNSIHENKGLYYNRSHLHKVLGFENSYFVLDNLKKAKRYDDEQLVTNDDIYKEIINTGEEERFMSLIITMSAHGPYKNHYICSNIDEISDSEYECVKYLSKRTDDFLKELNDRLEKEGMLDDTVIVLYSDHYAYSYSYSDDEKQLYDKIDDNQIIQNLPFIIYTSGMEHENFDDILVDDIDIVPTLFNLFGIKYDPKLYIGTDVFAKDHKNLVMFTDYSWYDGNIYSFNANVDKTSKEYEGNSNLVKDTLDLNRDIINTDYYRTIGENEKTVNKSNK